MKILKFSLKVIVLAVIFYVLFFVFMMRDRVGIASQLCNAGCSYPAGFPFQAEVGHGFHIQSPIEGLILIPQLTDVNVLGVIGNTITVTIIVLLFAIFLNWIDRKLFDPHEAQAK